MIEDIDSSEELNYNDYFNLDIDDVINNIIEEKNIFKILKCKIRNRERRKLNKPPKQPPKQPPKPPKEIKVPNEKIVIMNKFYAIQKWFRNNQVQPSANSNSPHERRIAELIEQIKELNLQEKCIKKTSNELLIKTLLTD